MRTVLVGPGIDLHVGGERSPSLLGHGVLRLVADADHPRPHLGQAAGEHRHLARVAGAEHEDVHQRSTRIVVTSSARARSTAAVSGSRTTTNPSPS